MHFLKAISGSPPRVQLSILDVIA